MAKIELDLPMPVFDFTVNLSVLRYWLCCGRRINHQLLKIWLYALKNGSHFLMDEANLLALPHSKCEKFRRRTSVLVY